MTNDHRPRMKSARGYYLRRRKWRDNAMRQPPAHVPATMRDVIAPDTPNRNTVRPSPQETS